MSSRIKGKIRLAIIGVGAIGKLHVGSLLSHTDKLECAALCDLSEANLKAGSEQLGGVKALYRDWETMLTDMADAIDAVVICLPHHLHARAIVDAARAGKHILCEKPMCISRKEAALIQSAVTRAGVMYMAAHNRLFTPVVQQAKREIDAGAIGNLQWLRAQDCSLAGGGISNPFQGAWQWRANARLQGGGILIDTGCHPIYLLMYLAGSPVVSVRAGMNRFHQQIQGEDTAAVQLRFANGALGEILTSWALVPPYGTHQIHVIGDRGQLFGSDRELYYLPTGFTEPAKRLLPAVDTVAEQMGHFAECLITGKRPLHSVAEGRAVLDVILKATEDAKGWERYARRQKRHTGRPA